MYYKKRMNMLFFLKVIKMNKRIFFFDIDETIVYDKKISPRVINAIHSIQKKGDYCIIASGRPPKFIPDFIKNVGFDGYVLANGAYVEFQQKVIYENILNYDHLNELIQFFKDTNHQYVLFTKNQCYLNKDYTILYDLFNSIGMNVDEFVYDFNEEDIMKETIKLEVWPNDQKADQMIKKQLTHFAWNQYSCSEMEVCSKSISKASGIKKIIDLLNIKQENTYCFGDGTNDIEMFECIENSYAMGNASKDVQSKAKYVCPSVQEDGVAVILERL